VLGFFKPTLATLATNSAKTRLFLTRGFSTEIEATGSFSTSSIGVVMPRS
jgi:hypothetical protein